MKASAPVRPRIKPDRAEAAIEYAHGLLSQFKWPHNPSNAEVEALFWAYLAEFQAKEEAK